MTFVLWNGFTAISAHFPVPPCRKEDYEKLMILDMLTSQIADPFRIGLLIAMIYTARNTAAQAGRVLPVLLGIVFVAVLIPVTLGSATDRTTAIAVGLVSNAVIVCVVWAIWEIVVRVRRG